MLKTGYQTIWTAWSENTRTEKLISSYKFCVSLKVLKSPAASDCRLKVLNFASRSKMQSSTDLLSSVVARKWALNTAFRSKVLNSSTPPKTRNSAGHPKIRIAVNWPKVWNYTTRSKMRNSDGYPKMRNSACCPKVLNYY